MNTLPIQGRPDRDSDALQKSIDEIGAARRAHALTIAQALFDLRECRVRAFGADAEVFGEPSWYLLLDIFIAEETGRQEDVTSAGIGSGAPQTTALRWITEMAKRGLIVRTRDRWDRRRTLLTLSPKGRNAVVRCLNIWDRILADGISSLDEEPLGTEVPTKSLSRSIRDRGHRPADHDRVRERLAKRAARRAAILRSS